MLHLIEYAAVSRYGTGSTLREVQMEPDYIRSPALLSRRTARLLIIDVQEKLVPAIHDADAIVANCADLLTAAELLNVPALATEQYPKGLGETVPALTKWLPTRPDKVRFSAAEVVDWTIEEPDGTSRPHVVIAGIEAHVCVQQTVMDLLSRGFSVHIPADAVGSRFPFDRDTALRRMRDHGATITTTETVIFELCETAAATEFKQVSKLIQQRGQRLNS